ncbi:VOC family protein [Aldersonia kunmingensis]|uniref:VOC family protein n=1 Tax=Aldersonia kunmingensis TaxID=408066 RepID=UPI00083221DC|nr:VOC family protein [Aldersonia kunmingensis]
MSNSRTYPQGVPSWIDVEPDDVEAAKAFYGGLFGWEFTQATPPDASYRYFIARVSGEDAAGIGGPAEPTGAATTAPWQTYIAVDNADTFGDVVAAAGGRIVTPPTSPGPAGTWVGYADPTGTEFRVWQAARRLGAQIANTPGAWNFSFLHNSDPEPAKAFYHKVFGWEFADLSGTAMIRRPGYGEHLATTIDPGIYERQFAVGAPPDFADAVGWVVQAEEQPHWQVSFTVADRDDSAATAERFGGKVVSTTDTEWTRDAVIHDPQGAVFTVSEFTPPS